MALCMLVTLVGVRLSDSFLRCSAFKHTHTHTQRKPRRERNIVLVLNCL